MKYFTNRQDNSVASPSNSILTNARIQHGWGYELGTGAGFTPGATITFPVAFTQKPIVIVTPIGYKDTSNPTDIGDFGIWEVLTYNCSVITTTNFFVRSGAGGVTIGAARRVGFAWIAIGV